ncbi:MAG: WD40 repeat domain-containing protein [Nostoc sp.]|uniref:WD40 repeat domain-containing protein n=1 Tax=Nostoc sp. TaxID=1180 RepID=UPI002FFB7FF4
MTENLNQPREYDAVLGGQVPPPVDALVLGGLEGAKLRLNSNDIKVRIAAFTELINYGEIGLDLLLDLFQNEKSEEVQKSAYLLLRYRTEAKVKKILQTYDHWQLFDDIGILEGESHLAQCMVISPDSQTLFTGGRHGTIKAWDLNLGKLKYTQLVKSASIISLDISLDGKTLVDGSKFIKIKVWEVKSDKIRRTQFLKNEGGGSIIFVALSADGQTLFSGTAYNSTKIWNLKTGIWQGFEGDKWAATSYAISQNKQTIVTGMHIINLWDVETRRLKKTFKSLSEVKIIAISPNEKNIIGAFGDKTIQIWDVDTGNIVHTLTGHSDYITSLAISSDGKNLVSASRDQTIKIWDLNTATLKKTLHGDSGCVNCIAISPDGQFITSGSNDKTINIWGVP